MILSFLSSGPLFLLCRVLIRHAADGPVFIVAEIVSLPRFMPLFRDQVCRKFLLTYSYTPTSALQMDLSNLVSFLFLFHIHNSVRLFSAITCEKSNGQRRSRFSFLSCLLLVSLSPRLMATMSTVTSPRTRQEFPVFSKTMYGRVFLSSSAIPTNCEYQ